MSEDEKKRFYFSLDILGYSGNADSRPEHLHFQFVHPKPLYFQGGLESRVSGVMGSTGNADVGAAHEHIQFRVYRREPQQLEFPFMHDEAEKKRHN